MLIKMNQKNHNLLLVDMMNNIWRKMKNGIIVMLLIIDIGQFMEILLVLYQKMEILLDN